MSYTFEILLIAGVLYLIIKSIVNLISVIVALFRSEEKPDLTKYRDPETGKTFKELQDEVECNLIRRKKRMDTIY